ncbi:Tunicamycin resistance protein [Filibacter tadaridae]|uniref:Tunicamycin resistance protein n=1 Tax=Filibacter tadaridae TaxID=2483811 RepID=A0A3P5XFY8_9BACL|nr:Tunicamycin resistance protein [Filibacter tadaridae]
MLKWYVTEKYIKLSTTGFGLSIIIIWINGTFGSGKTTAAYELQKRLKDSFV